MDRLTHMTDDYCAVYGADCWEDQNEQYCGPAIDRLAAYEDTGFTPSEFKDFIDSFKKVAELAGFIKEHDVAHLKELVRAEAEGRLMVFPFRRDAEQDCDKCSGVLYRQTTSGKIIPLEQRCGAKIAPPCYQPDGDGCAYQIYGDNNDEPIDRCKSCPLCYSDKVRHQHEGK